METIRGKVSRELHFNDLAERVAGYHHVLLDLGTGDGRFAHALAEQHPDWFVIGMDACRENLHEYSRAKTPNVLFAIASAQHLPPELNGLISHLTINFPWGSLLKSLLNADPALLDGLLAVSRTVTSIEIRLNAGALVEAGTALGAGAAQISNNLSRAGWQVGAPTPMSMPALHAFPSTWARRLAVGRDPRCTTINAWTVSQQHSLVTRITLDAA